MDEYTACEQAFQRGYEKGLKAQYGEAVAAVLRERDYFRSKARYYENRLRRKEAEQDVQVQLLPGCF